MLFRSIAGSVNQKIARSVMRSNLLGFKRCAYRIRDHGLCPGDNTSCSLPTPVTKAGPYDTDSMPRQYTLRLYRSVSSVANCRNWHHGLYQSGFDPVEWLVGCAVRKPLTKFRELPALAGRASPSSSVSNRSLENALTCLSRRVCATAGHAPDDQPVVCMKVRT